MANNNSVRVATLAEENKTNIAKSIESITNSRNTIRNKLIDFGLAQNNDQLAALATAISNITDNGSVQASVREGETYNIPKGYHDGSGTVSGVSGGGNYNLQSKTVTPTKAQQPITADEGYYGLSDVTVKAIPEAYQDVTAVTATAADVLATKVIVDATGRVTTGTMPNNGAVSKTLDATTTSYAVPAGYHSGTGSVSIVTETKTLTPTKQQQVVPATSGKVISSVTVAAIPGNYIDTTDATATAATILDGETAYVGGVKVEGTMPNNGAAEKTLTTSETSYTIPEGYHNGEGTVIIVPETKTVQPSRSEQNVTPTTGKVLSKVTVGAIPANLIDTTDATAEASDILSGQTAYVNGVKVTGSMTNNAAVNGTIDGLTTTSYVVPAGYTTGGTVSLTNEIETALAAI